MARERPDRSRRTAEHWSPGSPDKVPQLALETAKDLMLAAADEFGIDPRKQFLNPSIHAKGNRVSIRGEAEIDLIIATLPTIEEALIAGLGPFCPVDPANLQIHCHLTRPSNETRELILAGLPETTYTAFGAAFRDTPQHMPLEAEFARQAVRAIIGLTDANGRPLSDANVHAIATTCGRSAEQLTLLMPPASPDSVSEMIDRLQQEVIEPLFGTTAPGRVSINPGGMSSTSICKLNGVLGRSPEGYGRRLQFYGYEIVGTSPNYIQPIATYASRHVAVGIQEEWGDEAEWVCVELTYTKRKARPHVRATINRGLPNEADVSNYVRTHPRYRDLRPTTMSEKFGLLRPRGWNYASTTHGLFSNPAFPWNRP